MKLLSKSEIAQRQADAKKMEIDEGMKLAKRIDSLRDTLLQEEKSLELFRSSTVSLIHTEIVKEREVLNKLQNEVRELHSKRQELRIPLDEEWGQLRIRVNELESEKEIVRKEWEDIEIQKSELKKQEAEVSKTMNYAVLLKSRAEEELVEVNNDRIHSKEELAKSIKLRENAEHMALVFNKELKQRDTALAIRERDYTMREANLLERESAIENDWKLLEDRKATFERAINRLKQK